ncbi:MAG: transcriptional repressor [Spirochaetales bacterium]|jgi:Fe2+ or Zn2+ uptake regulation protein|nr:transcriptional repressor [Spirochaetales bacterium]
MHTSDILLTHNIRPSIHRILIYQYLINNKNHPTADTVYTNLHPQLPTLSKTTVYNVLSLFVDKKLIQELPLENGELRYDADTSEHAHFKCEKCGKVHDIFVKIGLPKIPNDFTISRSQLFLWGKCPDCD